MLAGAVWSLWLDLTARGMPVCCRAIDADSPSVCPVSGHDVVGCSCGAHGDEGSRAALASWLAECFGEGDVWLISWTFAGDLPPTYSKALRGATWLEQRLRRSRTSWFTSVERGSLRERLHLHTLTDDPQVRLQARWNVARGFTSKRGPVDSRTGAAMYVAKYTTKSSGMRDMPFMAGGPRFFGQTKVLNG